MRTDVRMERWISAPTQQDFAGSDVEEGDDDEADEKILVIHATVLDFINVIIEKGDAKAALSSSNSTENQLKFAATLIWNSITTNPELKDKKETLLVAATKASMTSGLWTQLEFVWLYVQPFFLKRFKW